MKLHRSVPWFLTALCMAFMVQAALGEGYTPPSSDPQNLHVFNDHVYFTADDGVHGRELWRTDGEGRVSLVADVTPGATGSRISKFTTFGNQILFRVDPETAGSQLWRTDGTKAGTRMIKQFDGSLGQAYDGLCGIWNEDLAFIRVSTKAAAIWRTDGTEAGTQPLPMTTEAGAPVGVDYDGIVHNGFFYFGGRHPKRGQILARSNEDGHMVTEVDQLVKPAVDFIELDKYRIVFRAADSSHGLELFISGGSAEHTFILFDIAPGPLDSFPSEFLRIDVPGGDPLVAFSADDHIHGRELWMSNGTNPGTWLVTEIMSGSEGSKPEGLVGLGERIFFTATKEHVGKELWTLGPPYVTATMVADTYAGPEGSDPYALCPLPGRGLFLSALNKEVGEELYFVDPNGEGMELAYDIYPGEESSSPYYTVALGDQVIFAATDPVHGRELWCADQVGQARLLADIYTDASVNPSSSPQQLTPAGDLLYFVANDIVHGAELWVSDGSHSGTHLLKDILPGPGSSDPQELTPFDPFVYFTADSSRSVGLWRTDGTTEGTVPIDTDVAAPLHLTVLKGRIFFSGMRPEEGRELWTLGPDQTTTLVRDIAVGPGSSNPRNMTVFDGALYFLADDGIHGEELWRSDGTESGTVMVRDIVEVPYEKIQVDALAPSGNQLFLTANNGAQGMELWRIQDDAHRPALVKDIAQWDFTNVVRLSRDR